MKIRTEALKAMKGNQKISCLTSYDSITAKIFDSAGIELILVGDSAANTVLGQDSTLGITLQEMITFGKAVAQSVKSAMTVLDLPFGSYELSAEQALENSIQAMKQTGADAVKLEGHRPETVAKLVQNGIPVMAHLGFTPQSLNTIGGYKVQGRDHGEHLLEQAIQLQQAGSFSIVLEMVPSELATKLTETLTIPTIGIGAGNSTDGQILVWQDFAGLNQKTPKFVREFANIGEQLSQATAEYVKSVRTGNFPSEAESFS